jgi:hypothetical protein
MTHISRVTLTETLMQMVEQKTAVRAVKDGEARNLRVVRARDGKWFFAFDVPAPDTGETQVFTLKTARGLMRTWSDPGRLFSFLAASFGVTTCSTVLEEAN